MVSLSDSPFLTLEEALSVNPMTFALRRLAADSKLSLVLVDGSKNRVANLQILILQKQAFIEKNIK